MYIYESVGLKCLHGGQRVDGKHLQVGRTMASRSIIGVSAASPCRASSGGLGRDLSVAAASRPGNRSNNIPNCCNWSDNVTTCADGVCNVAVLVVQLGSKLDFPPLKAAMQMAHSVASILLIFQASQPAGQLSCNCQPADAIADLPLQQLSKPSHMTNTPSCALKQAQRTRVGCTIAHLPSLKLSRRQ